MALSSSLISKIVNGGLWSLWLRVTGRSMGLVRTAVLARLLLPEDFGQIGIVMAVLTVLDCVSQFGLPQALIQRSRYDEEVLDTIWTVSILRNAAVFALVFALAPAVQDFYGIEGLASLMRAVALSVLMTGLTNVGVILFQRELDFKRNYYLEAVPALLELAVSVAAAYCLRSVWALVLGGMVLNACRLVLSYGLHPYRPSFRIHRAKLKELLGFGKWIFLSGIVVTLITQADSIFVGRWFGAAALGYYQMAFLISNVAATEITNTISQVVFPSYARIRHDRERTREAYLRVVHLIMVTCWPVAAGLFVLSTSLTEVFLGERWLSIVPLVRVMSILSLLRAFGGSAIALLWGMGVPDATVRYSGIQLLCLSGLMVPLAGAYGLDGAAAGVAASYLVLEGLYARRVLSLIGAGWLSIVRIAVVPGMSALAMGATIATVNGLLGSGPLNLTLTAGIGIVCYAGMLFVLDAVFTESKTRGMVMGIVHAARASASA